MILYSAVGCAAVFGIVLVAKLINKGAIGQQELNIAGTQFASGNNGGGVSTSAPPNIKAAELLNQIESTPTADFQNSYNEWSEWSDMQPTAASNRQIEMQYSEKVKEMKTSTSANDAVNGWDIVDSKNEIKHGKWSEWTTETIEASEIKEVDTRSETKNTKTQYGYYRYVVTITCINKFNWRSCCRFSLQRLRL